jgi:hypothetical protein
MVVPGIHPSVISFWTIDPISILEDVFLERIEKNI